MLVQLFDTEANRKIKKEPAVADTGVGAGTVKGSVVFPVSSTDDGKGEENESVIGGDILSELWVFA